MPKKKKATNVKLNNVFKEIKKEAAKKKKDLALRQEKFCQLYTTDREFFGNGVEAYLEVYDVDKTKKNWYKTACSAASRLLSNVKVYTRINELLKKDGFNNEHVDKQLLFLINQFSDFAAKGQAIREFNKLKKRITDKMEIDVTGQSINSYHNLSNAQLIEIANGGGEKGISKKRVNT